MVHMIIDLFKNLSKVFIKKQGKGKIIRIGYDNVTNT
ncbi:hypothetical protein MNBD_DELTA02-244 [hydrothermal vent metagenome]|uniref:Uncharacterized protein n=1 Tax=hydrothermal vent metagenome TaxID=652676 RepID=A0A3B0VI63_9ZZZZ